MNEPKVVKVSWSNGRYTVDTPEWNGGEVVGLDEIATYIEKDSQIFLAIVPGETKHRYGLRMLKELAAEIRRLGKTSADQRTEYAGPGAVTVTPDFQPEPAQSVSCQGAGCGHKIVGYVSSVRELPTMWCQECAENEWQRKPSSCWCETCRPVTMEDMRFVVCPSCGNKRCPRANDHRNSCTNSNEPGQPGSSYPA